MPYIEHELGQTFYQVRGRKTAPGLPVVCLHGGPGGQSKRMAGLFDLSADRKVYVYDQIGGGRSSATEKRRWNIGTFVEELDTLVDAWGLDEFHLFGASWGTTLALEYYLRHKRRVRSIVFQSPLFSTADWEADANRLIRRLPPAERKVIRTCHDIGATDSQVYRDAMRVYYSRHVCRNREQLKRFFSDENPQGKQVYQHMWGPSEFKATGSLKRYDKVHRLAGVNRPALVICGEHDEAQPATGRRYADAMPQGEFAEIRGASHAILAEQPRRLVRTIGQFLGRQD
jgi:proline iminopeptidase